MNFVNIFSNPSSHYVLYNRVFLIGYSKEGYILCFFFFRFHYGEISVICLYQVGNIFQKTKYNEFAWRPKTFHFSERHGSSLVIAAKQLQEKTREEESVTQVDIVLDNSGFELITDLVLADFLLSSKLATKIHFYGKTIPWFVSDTTIHDFNWIIKQLKHSNNKWVSQCGVDWEDHIKTGRWVYSRSYFGLCLMNSVRLRSLLIYMLHYKRLI